MRLAFESAVRADLGLGSSPDYIAATLAALDAATMALEADLGTSFDRQTNVDTFIPTVGCPFHKLKLSQGFVVAGSVQMLYSPTYTDLFTNTPLDITSICKIDYEKGCIKAPPASYDLNSDFRGFRDHCVQVTYQAGFETDALDPLLYDQTQVPLWLAELAKMKARIAMSGHPALDSTNITFDVKSMQLPMLYSSGISRHSRYMPDAIYAR